MSLHVNMQNSSRKAYQKHVHGSRTHPLHRELAAVIRSPQMGCMQRDDKCRLVNNT